MEFLKTYNVDNAIKLVSSAKEIIKDIIVFETESKTNITFSYNGYCGNIKFDYIFALMSICLFKTTNEMITENDIEFIEELNTYFYSATLGYDMNKQKVYADCCLSLDGFTVEIFNKELILCYDIVETFFATK